VAAAAGDSTKKVIADRIGISVATVDFHFRNISRKVGAHTRAGILTITYAIT
jgi:DNA-binding CsgD family transcriptional regulator